MLKVLFSTKVLAVGMAVGLTASTVSIYAAGITGSAKRLGGTGDTTVSAPSNDAAVSAWTLTNGLASAATVSWTPTATSNYTVNLVVKSSTGTIATGSTSVSGTSGSGRNDSITLSGAVSPQSIDSTNVVISES